MADSNKFRGPTGNPYLAYNLHGELVLSPDDIWLQISSNIGKYIDEQGEKMRSKIVDFEGKKQLNVIFSCDSFEYMDPFSNKFAWGDFLKSLSEKKKIQNLILEISFFVISQLQHQFPKFRAKLHYFRLQKNILTIEYLGNVSAE